MDSNILMAILDYIPVVMFLNSGILIQHYLKNQMHLFIYIILLISILIIFIAGFAKATHKLFSNANLYDIKFIIKYFFPVQSFCSFLFGFTVFCQPYYNYLSKKLIIFIILIPILIIIEIFSNTLVYIILLITGFALLNFRMGKSSYQKGMKICTLLYGLSFLCDLGMGMMSPKDFSVSFNNWIAQGINTTGQVLFLVATYLWYKKIWDSDASNRDSVFSRELSNNASLISV